MSPKTLRIAQFNLENLFILFDQRPSNAVSSFSESQWQRLSSSTTPNKPLQQVLDLANVIKDINADIWLLSEVGGRESLENFNEFFLDSRFKVQLIEGNSDRGIDLGYLISGSLPFTIDVLSHKSRNIDFLYPHEMQSKNTGYLDQRKTSHKFSRDVLELRLFESGQPILVILSVHLKSQLDRQGLDPKGRDRRGAELAKLIQIAEEIRSEMKGAPLLIGGDFNGIVNGHTPDPEFEPLRRTAMKDVLEIAQVEVDKRFTHLKVWNNRPALYKQLDYIFLDPPLFPAVVAADSFVYRYKDEFGMARIVPRNMNEKRLLPSDHYPVVLTLDLNAIEREKI